MDITGEASIHGFPSLGVSADSRPPRVVAVADDAALGGSQSSFAARVPEEATEGALEGSHFPKGRRPQEAAEAEEATRGGSLRVLCGSSARRRRQGRSP